MPTDELADQIYDDLQASGLKGDSGDWYLETIGNIPRYVRMNLQQLKEARNNAHPDNPGGSHEKFLKYNRRYEEALERTKSNTKRKKGQ